MPVTALTPLPPAPSIADPTNFEAEADALLGALPTMVAQQNTAFGQITGIETDLLALVANAGYASTSTTSLVIGTGSKTLTVQAGRAYVAGTWVIVADAAAPATNNMIGQVTSYNSGTGALVVNVIQIAGSGTLTSWTVSLTGAIGATGPVASTNFTASSSTTLNLTAGGRFRLTAQITAGTIQATPGVGGNPIQIMTDIEASTNYHTFTANGAETVTVNGVADTVLWFDLPRGRIITLIPTASGWVLGA